MTEQHTYTICVEFKKAEERNPEEIYEVEQIKYPMAGFIEFGCVSGDSYIHSLDTIRYIEKIAEWKTEDTHDQ